MQRIEPRFLGIAYIAGRTRGKGFPKLEAHVGHYQAINPRYQDGVILVVREDGQHIVLEENDPLVARETRAMIEAKIVGNLKRDTPDMAWPYNSWTSFAKRHIYPIGTAIHQKFEKDGPWKDTHTSEGLAVYTSIFPWAKEQIGRHNLERLLRESLGLDKRMQPDNTRRRVRIDRTDDNARATLQGVITEDRQPVAVESAQAVSA